MGALTRYPGEARVAIIRIVYRVTTRGVPFRDCEAEVTAVGRSNAVAARSLAFQLPQASAAFIRILYGVAAGWLPDRRGQADAALVWVADAVAVRRLPLRLREASLPVVGIFDRVAF